LRPELLHGDAARELNGWLSYRPPRLDPIDLFALGVSDFVDAIAEGRAPRLAADRALHVLEIMLAAYRSARQGCAVDLQSTCALN
jgi:predicted dehydrogenase